MRGFPIFAAALACTAAPSAAQNVPPDDADVILAVQRFMSAIGNEDKSALADHMIPEAMIFVHNQMDPDNPRLDIVPVAAHLARWAAQTRSVSEIMTMDFVTVEGDMAQVVGAYTFRVEGEISHCGVNSLSLAKMEDGWRIGNTSFTMVSPDRCEEVGAPETPQETSL